MKALVIGASGFVGRYLIKFLAERNYEVVGTFHKELSVKIEKDCKQWAKLDICQKDQVSQLIYENQPDELYLLAGVAVTTGPVAELYYRVNFLGTLNVLEAVKEFSPETRILLVSSASTYGIVDPDRLPIVESQPLHPLNHYAASKAAAEKAAHAYNAEGLHIVIARPFNHTGPGQSTEYVCSHLAKQVANIFIKYDNKKNGVVEAGNVDVARDFTDVRDVVRAYWLLIQKGNPGEVYNVCSEKAYSIREIVSILGKAIGLDINIKSVENLKRRKDVPILIGSRAKIRRDTGWEPHIPIEVTLKDILNYWLNIQSEYV